MSKMNCVLGILLISLLPVVGGTLVHGATQPASFSAPRLTQVNSDYTIQSPSALGVIGDFNRDGIPDVAVTGLSTVSVLFGKGNGTFATPTVYSILDQSGYAGIAAVDVNGDGILDLIVTNNVGSYSAGYTASVEVLLGNPDGTFEAGIVTSVPGDFVVYSMAVGDLNSDGKLDVVVTEQGINSDINAAATLLGNGDGTFQAPVAYAAPTSASGTIAVADLNGDGFLDVVVGNQSNASISILLGDGSGGFSSSFALNMPGYPNYVMARDLNADGFADLVIAGYGVEGEIGSVWVLLGNGNGTFKQAVVYGSGQNPGAFAMGDVNEDGKLDIVSAGPEVFLGNGDGTFRPAVSFYPATTIIGVADFNLDGKPDILTLTNQTLAMLLGKGDDSFVSLPDYTRGFPSKILTGDFNGDGVTDLAFLEDGSGIATLLGQAGGKFKQGSSLQLNLRPGSLKFLVSGDFNHDGKVDIAFADSYSGVGAIYVAFGNGEGGFLTPVEYTVPDAVYSLVVADFNRDGNLDLAVSGAKGIYILFGTASGTFGSATLSASYLNEGSKVMASGDFNGDGLVDLFAAGSSGIQVYLGKGNGTFHTAATYAGSDANAVIVWDLNKDGKQDVVVSTTSGTEILLGNGTGTFSAGQTLQFTSGVIAVADFNKDGFPDLAIATSWDIAILLGNGDGTFQPAPVSGYGNGVLAAGIVAADFNGDGKPDIAFSSGDFEDDSGPVAVLLNTTP
jgi:hypothetical protein